MRIEKSGQPATFQKTNNEPQDEGAKDSKIGRMGRRFVKKLRTMGSRFAKKLRTIRRALKHDKQQAASFPEESTIRARSVKVASKSAQDAVLTQSGNALKSTEKPQNDDSITESMLPEATPTETFTVTESHAGHQPSIPPDALNVEPPSTSSHEDADFLVELTQLFNEKGADGLTVDKEGKHPLHYAAQHGLIHSVQYLLEKGDAQQLINLKDKEQNNLTHMAASAGHIDLLNWLSDQYGTEVLLTKGHNGFTVLHSAAKEGHLHCVERLLDLVPDSLNLRENGGSCAIHWAAWAGKLDVLKVMVKKCGEQILLQKGANGNNALHFAAKMGHLDCVDYILAKCSGKQNLVNNMKQNAFHLAVQCGRTDILRYLIDKNKNDFEGLKAADENGNTPLHLAAASGYDQCVAELLKSGDDLYKLKNKTENISADLAAFNGNLEVLKQLYKQDPAALMGKATDSSDVLRFAAQQGHLDCVEYIMEKCEGLQHEVGELGHNVVHRAASNGRAEVLRFLIAKSDAKSLIATDKKGNTPLHAAVFNNRLDCVKALLSDQTIQKNMSRIDLFGCLVSSNPNIAELLSEVRKKNAIEHIGWCVDYLDQTVSKQSRIGQSAEWPLMAKKKSDSSSLALQAETVLSSLERVGIYLHNPAYIGETEKQFWSMGDLNAGVQMANILERMGAKSLDVMLSPPDDSSWSQRRIYQESEKCTYKDKQKITLHKLARLWPGFDPAKGLPQTLTLGSCQVSFRDCDDESSDLPPAMFSFIDAMIQYPKMKKLPDSIITLKPYRYAPGSRILATDIQGNRGNVFPLRLPDNNAIPEIKNDSHGIERSSIVTPRAVDSSPLEKVINRLNEKSRSGQLDLGVVYGLHHEQLSNAWPTVLDKWLSTVKAYAKQSTDQKPAIIAVASNVNLETDLKQFAEKQKLPLIDLSTISCVVDDQQEAVAEQLIQQISQLQPGEPALCILPSLSKPQFDELVLSSRLPTLAEGANLTSFLLQHGHPHLSVLPSGQTPVAQDMGDPFEALKAQAFSYKLALNKAEQEVLELLTSLIKGKEKESYKKAIDKINGLDPQKVPNLRFLWELPKPSTFLELEQLTVMKLLKKGQEGKLGDTGQNALLSAFDPSPEAFEQYTRNAMNEESATARHFELQKMHINGPSLNAVASALVQLGKYKGVLK